MQNREKMRVYSGDMTVLANAKQHRVAISSDIGVAGVLKLCTAVTNHSSVSLIAAENFDFASSTTGKLVYVKTNLPVKV